MESLRAIEFLTDIEPDNREEPITSEEVLDLPACEPLFVRIKKYKQGTKTFTPRTNNADCLENYLVSVGLLNRQPFAPISMNQQVKP